MTMTSICPAISPKHTTIQFGSTVNGPSKTFPNGINPNMPALKGIQACLTSAKVACRIRYYIPLSQLQEPYCAGVSFSVNKSTNTVRFYVDNKVYFSVDGTPPPSLPGIRATTLEDVQVDVNLNSGEIISCSESLTIPQAKTLLEKVLKP